MSSESAATSPESGGRRPRRLAAVGAVLLQLVNLGCGLKGDPLPPLRPPEPTASEAPAETGANGEESEDADPEAEGGDGEEDGDRAQVAI